MSKVTEFRCPHCLKVFDKDEALTAILSGEENVGESYYMVHGSHSGFSLKCRKCHNLIDTSGLFEGKYDVGDYLPLHAGVFLVLLMSQLIWLEFSFLVAIVLSVLMNLLLAVLLEGFDKRRFMRKFPPLVPERDERSS